MYNGLFVAKDSLIQNGAAYGTGIYLSNSSSFSLGYSGKHINCSANLILGVFQVKNPLQTYVKTSNIYVVPEESNVCLRYLIYMKRSNGVYSITNAMDRYFIHGEMVKEVSAATAIIDKVWSRRVMSEIRELQARDGIMGDDGLRYLVTMENGGDSMNVIHLAICRDTFGDSPLGKDMDHMGIESIKMEVRLPGNYPFEPPFIRVLSPKFAFRKGHITIGGSVCIDILTKQRWVPSLNIPNIMITIVQNMITGDGRLEPGGKNYVYSLKESQDAFTRMLSTHASEWA
jgi:ubiquitin-protein ligase